MDVSEAFYIWRQLGGTLDSIQEDLGFRTNFVKDGKVHGYIQAAPGVMYWEYPDEVMENQHLGYSEEEPEPVTKSDFDWSVYEKV